MEADMFNSPVAVVIWDLFFNIRSNEIEDYFLEEFKALTSMINQYGRHDLSSSEIVEISEETDLPIGPHRHKLEGSYALEDIPEGAMDTNLLQDAMLKFLDITRCPNLTSLGDTLPTTLKVLRLMDCPKLESIVDKLNKDTLLEQLFIYSCENLRCLPNNIHNLNFLQDLSIFDCPSIVSFPEEGFPTNLRELWLSGANICRQLFELGLHRLTSLTFLSIAYGIMDSFPEEEDGKTTLMLPTSLTTLTLLSFSNLLFLSGKFFQNLSALEEISISLCPKLASLSEECFPPSLQQLEISWCPVLKQNYKKDGGIMWSKIANIPSVIIDDVEQ